ncbi:siderophore ABC transporter substrate-binding protein [Vibrio coralliilyticus]|uniref:siderophore ABC transporter substrate-binding protein n=1 Tax=Vibrio coralliilyticus TaxID=190893 RepID=UPI0007DC15AE|nr:siderophore ABC transporter substrate-binding protein [Vibrio coralliilyticus]AXN32908.1 siderophore ABC transporter substrate-binding protein [Vibrio coralliilyticus]
MLIKSWVALCLMLAASLVHAGMITVTHPLGETTLESKPARVIVLGMDTLDVLDNLGIEPVAVVKSPMPHYLSKYQDDSYVSAGSLFEPDFETIFALKPDLIIASNRSSESYPELSKIAPTIVFMADARRYWQSTQAAWRMMGKVFEREEDIERKINQAQARIDQIRQQTKITKPKALVVMTNGGKLTTFGQDSRYGAIFTLFGFEPADSNNANKVHGDLISYEYIAQSDPEHLLILDRDQAIGRDSGEAFKKLDNPLMSQTQAAKNNRIHFLNPHAWYISASGIQATQMMIDDMSQAVK